MWLTTYFKPVNHFTLCKRFCLIFPHYLFSCSSLFAHPTPATLRGTLCGSLTGLHSVLGTEWFLFLYISISLNTVSLASNVLFLTGLLTCLFISTNIPFKWCLLTGAIQELDTASSVLTVLASC